MPLEVLKRLSQNTRMSKVVNIQNLMKSKSSSEDFQENNEEALHQKPVKFSINVEPSKNTIPEVDENQPIPEVKVTTKTPLMRNLSFTQKNKSMSNSYLHQIKMKKHSVDVPNLHNNKVTESCPMVYGNALSVENQEVRYLIQFRFNMLVSTK